MYDKTVDETDTTTKMVEAYLSRWYDVLTQRISKIILFALNDTLINEIN